MSQWNAAELAEVDAEYEIRVAAYRPDNTLRDLRIVWHVVVDDALFIRSVRGVDGAWYRGVQRTGFGVIEAGRREIPVQFVPDGDHDEAIDAAYRAKYGNGSPVQAITSDAARATTLRVEPGVAQVP